MMKENTEKYSVPPEGSLGLLAYGYLGLLAWRKARNTYEKSSGKRLRFFQLEDKTDHPLKVTGKAQTEDD